VCAREAQIVISFNVALKDHPAKAGIIRIVDQHNAAEPVTPEQSPPGESHSSQGLSVKFLLPPGAPRRRIVCADEG